MTKRTGVQGAVPTHAYYYLFIGPLRGAYSILILNRQLGSKGHLRQCFWRLRLSTANTRASRAKSLRHSSSHARFIFTLVFFCESPLAFNLRECTQF